jgi:translation initiation factor 2-alpha kinase 4
MRKTKAHLKALVRELASVGGNSSRPVIRRHTRSSSEMLSMDSDEETDWSLQQIHSVYESRFLNEFEPVKLLGRSSSYSTFSRVFEAKKRIDGKFYAVKRIKLPAGKESRAKIMKEITV